MEEFQEILALIKASYFLKVLKFSGGVIFIAIWLGSISFVLKDASKRYGKKSVQILMVLLPLFFHLAGLLIYFLIRPAKTIAEKVYEQEILGFQELTFGCPMCGTEIKETFVFCPCCGEELFVHCDNCSKMVRRGWKFCPYCRKGL